MISVVMLSWKRPYNVYKIVRQLKKNKCIDDIIIWNNNPKEKLSCLNSIKDVTVVRANRDCGMNARFYACLMAKNETIYQQDDDLIVSNTGIGKLYREFKKDPYVIHGIWGRNPSDQYLYVSTNIYSKAEIILGRAAMFHKGFIIEAFRKMSMIHNKIVHLLSKVGGDVFFSYAVMSIAKRKNRVHKFCKYVTELPAPHAIWERPHHWINRTIIMRECRRAFGIGTEANTQKQKTA